MNYCVRDRYFAEIVQSSLKDWCMQSWKWNRFPSFGELVVVESSSQLIFGIVSDIVTGSLDQSRIPYAYQKTEEELLCEQPQIFEFLQTHLTCTIIGYQENNISFYQLAPQPAKIHAFVRSATQDERDAFFSQPHYISLIFNYPPRHVSVDELLLAILAYRNRCKPLEIELMNDFLDHYSLLTGNDYRRLKLFLQRVQMFYG